MTRKTQVRFTKTMVTRADNMRRLIGEFRIGCLAAIEIQIMFNFSESGVRRYVTDLKEWLLIEVESSRPTKTGVVLTPKYRLCVDPDVETRIANYLANLDAPKILSAEMHKEQRLHRKKSKLESDPTRHFHLMSDDAPFQVKFNKKPVKRDEFQALFFGEKGMAKP